MKDFKKDLMNEKVKKLTKDEKNEKVYEERKPVKKSGDSKRPCTYMLKCADGSLYTGWTNDIQKRVASHNAGKGGKYTRVRTPVELVHLEYFDTKEEAMSREYAIKQLSRKKKLELCISSR